MSKTPILVLSSYTPEASGGFWWWPDTAETRADALELARHDGDDFALVFLVTLSVADVTRPQKVTDFIDDNLLDRIERGQLGHILAAYRVES